MRRSDLLCARCGGRVAEGRCATCRLARDELRTRADRLVAWLLLVALAIVATLLVSARVSFA